MYNTYVCMRCICGRGRGFGSRFPSFFVLFCFVFSFLQYSLLLRWQYVATYEAAAVFYLYAKGRLKGCVRQLYESTV
ncbi:hypothetical protein B9Z19DRAFT_1092158 [Tuber borchii]|uniref:Uncharacterized protein n=1 Tax=Tuber borchii TaxID=42251 RepID=A0A2T6ZGW5_TUBBO|nr:hypothetical protein B9Z19DRAFT_1092158 [Tuber borchii]